MKPGPRNLISDVPGLRVGNAQDARLKSGVTVLTAGHPFTAAVHVMGGAPGTRETDLLEPDRLVAQVDALVLSGGSAFGLAAADGVASELRAQGRGFQVGGVSVPIVPGAILFDLTNGGDKGWTETPYPALGRAALRAAAEEFALGSVGAGTGAVTMDLKGGLGSASAVLEGGLVVGALVAVNALGSAVVPSSGGRFWAAPFELGDEFGGRGIAAPADPGAEPDPIAARARSGGTDNGAGTEAGATTIAIVATNARLSQAEAKRLAVAAHDGMARALVPSHTPLDGDLVFSLSTGERELADPVRSALALGHAASLCLARAIARGVHAARAAPGDRLPCWQDAYGVTPA